VRSKRGGRGRGERLPEQKTMSFGYFWPRFALGGSLPSQGQKTCLFAANKSGEERQQKNLCRKGEICAHHTGKISGRKNQKVSPSQKKKKDLFGLGENSFQPVAARSLRQSSGGNLVQSLGPSPCPIWKPHTATYW